MSDWIEVTLTKDQKDLLNNYNIITSHNAMYILGLGEFYKVEKEGTCYMTNDAKLLPATVLKDYKWILNRELERYDKD